MERVARLISHRPGLVVTTVVAGVLAVGAAGLKLELNSTITSLLPADSPAWRFYQETVEDFGNDEVDVVGVVAEDVFAKETLEKIRRLTGALEKVDGVGKVISLTNARDPIADVYAPPLLVPEIPRSASGLRALRDRIRRNRLYAGNLVSPDGRGAAINVFLATRDDADYLRRKVDEHILELLEKEQGPERLVLTGTAHVKAEALRLMRRDLVRLTPVAILVVGMVLLAAFRSKRAVALPLVAVALGTVATLGVMGLRGDPITIGTVVLPSLLVVIGSAYGTYVVDRFDRARGERGSRTIETLREVALPVAVSAATTAIGFSSLMLSHIPAVRDLGAYAALGIVVLALLALTVVPALLALLPPLPASRRGAGSMIMVERLGRLAVGRRGLVLAGGVMLFALGCLGIPRVVTDTNFLSYFPRGAKVREDTGLVNRRVVGAVPISLVVDTGEHNGALRPATLRQIKELQAFLATRPGVTTSVSIVDYLELLDEALRASGGEIVDEEGNVVGEPPGTIWEDPRQFEDVVRMLISAHESFREAITSDFSRARILVRTTIVSSQQVAEILREIDAYVRAHFVPTVTVVPTGSVVLLNTTTDDVVWGQAKSVGLALTVIFALMAVMFVSLKVGLLSMLPSLLPIGTFFGIVGWGGFSLNLATSVIAAIALGIVVDHTIHYMVHFNRELRASGDQMASLMRALHAVGRPIVVTSVALAAGFLTVCASGFLPLRSFGVLSSATMVVAMLSNLLFLPALLATTRIITVWDLLALRLGPRPHETIPLFAGLRPGQARVVVLMGQLVSAPAGGTVVREGEAGDRMFVIISGTAEVRAGWGDSRELIRRLGRGEVFGEMGVVRAVRSADVVAAEPLELLAVDRAFLDRLQRRYPRIASRVFLNLARILSDRLAGTTERLVEAAHASG